MKKFNYLLCIILTLLSHSACSDDLNSQDDTPQNKKNEEIFIKDTDGNIVNEISEELYTLILSDLEKENQISKKNSLLENYNLDTTTNKYIIKEEYQNDDKIKTKSSQNYFLYRAHLHNIGWLNYVNLGITAGSVGKKTAMEAVEFTSNIYIPAFRAQAHVRGKGWLPEVGFGQTVGTVGETRNLEAIRINVPASFATNVYYRVHISYQGWQGYVRNNQMAGTTGKNLGIEAIEIHMFIL